jgi:hypothetical protein
VTLLDCTIAGVTPPTALDICGDPAPTVDSQLAGVSVDLTTFVFTTSSTIQWIATDAAGNTSVPQSTSVTVDDQTPPMVTPPEDVDALLCQTAGAVEVGEATALDGCAGDLEATGQVISSNGIPLAVPVDIVNGVVVLGFGTHIIRWTAIDDDGNVGEALQTVVVRSAIQADGSFLVQDRAELQASNLAPAALLNSGSGNVRVGVEAVVGEIVAGGSVNVADRGNVFGDITAVGPISVSQFANHTGIEISVPSVSLPALPTLPAFPPPVGDNLFVNPGQTLSLAPGSYANVSVNSSATTPPTLILASGDYFFTGMFLNPASVILAEADTRIFVSGAFVFHNSIQLNGGGGALAPVFLGLAGAGSVVMEAPVRRDIGGP